MRAKCEPCASKDEENARLRTRVDELVAQVRELDKLCTLLQADLDRYKQEASRLQPNRPEHAPAGQLQLAFEQVIASFASTEPANDSAERPQGAVCPPESPAPAPPSPPRPGHKPHGRRRLDTTKLPVEEIVIEPEEVRAAGGEGFVRIGEEVSERLAFRPACYVVLRTIRPKYARVSARAAEPSAAAVLCAPVPPNFWPRAMADVSAIVEIILGKYDACLPLHRQERLSARHGFHLPRSTQCDWLGAAAAYLYRIVDAMMAEARTKAFCIATDATGAPVRLPGECATWHVFVFIADRDHVVFRATRRHTSKAIAEMLEGFRGHLLSDAALIYDTLHRDHGVLEVCCWFHLRRYFWRCRDTEPTLAMEALSMIAKLFEVERATKDLSMPERTAERARRAAPLLELFERWLGRIRTRVDARSPLQAAITYYDNQREGLRRFLTDGRLRLDNNISEGQLRNLVLGRRNWGFFENPEGLRWYTIFRSLIASCALHGLDATRYLDEVLRLAPHWPTTRMLELSPKHWASTRERLSDAQRACLRSPWEMTTKSQEGEVARAA